MPDAAAPSSIPSAEAPTLSLICEIADPLTREGYARDQADRPAGRGVPERDGHRHLQHRAGMRFFVDSVSRLADHRSHYAIDSAEGHWNSGEPGLSFTVRPKSYFRPHRTTTLHDLPAQ
jgi:glutamine synthetase